MFRRKYLPYAALFEITLKCNMRCLHCGSSAGTQRVKELSTDDWIRIIREFSKLGCESITLLGGEPFVNHDWFEISKEIKDHKMNLTIISNGLMIDDETISHLRELDPYAIAISLDGGSPEIHDNIRQVKGSFEKATKAISMLRDADINTSVITTLSKLNFKELPQIRSLLLNKNIAWQIQIACPVGRFQKELMLSKEEFYTAALFIANSIEKYSIEELPITGAHCFGYHSGVLPNINITPSWRGCPAGLFVIGIQSNGGVKGCLSLSDEFLEGNVMNNSLSEIWENVSFASYNRKFKKDDLNGECTGCKYGKNCRGGCMSVSTSVTGKSHADPYCLRLIEKSKDLK
jgi:radical SAM protein with 4Fe4S-binding SPASM domain